MNPGPESYSRTAIGLHWAIAALVITNLAFGLYTVDMPLSPQKLRNFSWHKWIGVTVFLLGSARLLWRLWHPPPPLPVAMPAWERVLARASHGLLYFLVLAAPLSGWLFSSASGFQTVYLGSIPIPDLLDKDRALAEVLKPVHRWINYTMATLVALHAAAAVKHHVVDRDQVLARMLPFLRGSGR